MKNEVKEAIAQFPATFGLRGFPGQTFRISEWASYVSGDLGVQLVVQVHRRTDRDVWLDFSRGSVEELKMEVVKL